MSVVGARGPAEGEFVSVRGRPWLVDSRQGDDDGFPTVSLSCIADDAQGETLEVIWDAEIGASVIDDNGWETVGLNGPDSAEVPIKCRPSHLRLGRPSTRLLR